MSQSTWNAYNVCLSPALSFCTTLIVHLIDISMKTELEEEPRANSKPQCCTLWIPLLTSFFLKSHYDLGNHILGTHVRFSGRGQTHAQLYFWSAHLHSTPSSAFPHLRKWKEHICISWSTTLCSQIHYKALHHPPTCIRKGVSRQVTEKMRAYTGASTEGATKTIRWKPKQGFHFCWKEAEAFGSDFRQYKWPCPNVRGPERMTQEMGPGKQSQASTEEPGRALVVMIQLIGISDSSIWGHVNEVFFFFP